jgi:hypothetical protein
MRQNSQVGIHDSRFTHSLLVHVNTCGRVVRDGIQHHRDFWWTFEDTPHAFFYSSRPASEDTNRERHAVTLAVVRWPWQVSGTGMPRPKRRTVSQPRARAGAGCVARPSGNGRGFNGAGGRTPGASGEHSISLQQVERSLGSASSSPTVPFVLDSDHPICHRQLTATRPLRLAIHPPLTMKRRLGACVLLDAPRQKARPHICSWTRPTEPWQTPRRRC